MPIALVRAAWRQPGRPADMTEGTNEESIQATRPVRDADSRSCGFSDPHGCWRIGGRGGHPPLSARIQRLRYESPWPDSPWPLRRHRACGAGQGGLRVHNTSDAANGTPPLIFHGGPVMGTQSTGPVVVTPIFWNPAGHPMDSAYKSIITTYLAGVAKDSGLHTNVYSTLNEYFGSNGAISYQVKLGKPINDTNPLPANGCKVNGKDTKRIYADNSGYNACLDDDQVIAETNSVVNAHGLPVNLGHIYVLFLPKHVESCFFAGSTTTASNACTINYQPSAAYCAYHSQAPNGTVYANMPYPIYASPVGFTCSSDARFPDCPDAERERRRRHRDQPNQSRDHGGYY